MTLRFWRAADRSQAPAPAAVPAASAAPSSYHGIFDHLSPAIIARGMDRLRRLALFSPAAYEKRDEGPMDGPETHDHAFRFGMFEERQIFDPIDLSRFLAEPMALAGEAGPPAAMPMQLSGPVAVYVSTRGNLFMGEIARDLVRDLRAVGVQAELRDETSPVSAQPPISIFVAPHEFFILGDGWDWVRDEVLASAIMLSTEQMQTGWFAKSLPLLLMSRGVIDMCRQTVNCLNQISIPAYHLVPGVEPYQPPLGEADRQHPLYQVLPAPARRAPHAETPFSERPLDIAFFGSDSLRRHRFFAHHAPTLAGFSNVIYMRPLSRGPVADGGHDGALIRLASHVCGHARITLNIHRSEFGYFEWHRIVRLGMTAGSVVVSDRCLPQGHFVPGVHYLEETPRQIPNLLAWLLRSEEGRAVAERIQRNALALLAQRFAPAQAGAQVGAFLARIAAQ